MSSARLESNSRENWIHSWSRTTTGIVLMLLVVQFTTGTLLAFYYVPSVDHAHNTVSFIEKVLSSGSWIRSLHHFGSQWLSLFTFLHVLRLYWHSAYRHYRTQWLAALSLLALVMAAGATGYSLPWDARAFFSTRIAEGLVSGLPLVGQMARLWLLGGNEVSTLTLSRFFALHVLITPFLILVVVTWRFRSQQQKNSVGRICWPGIARQAIAAGLIFLALGLWAMKTPAPFGPAAADAGANYLPRPGAQFLWLYQTLKYVPGGLGSVVGVVLPAIVLLLLASLPWLNLGFMRKFSAQPQRLLGGLVLGSSALLVASMTTLSYINDRSNVSVREQLARQSAQERFVRQQPFTPSHLNADSDIPKDQSGVPGAYTRFCTVCHGARGEGGRQGALKFPTLIGVAAKPRRTVDDIVSLLNDPQAYGLEPPMRSFANKLTGQEKREIAEWIVGLH